MSRRGEGSTINPTDWTTVSILSNRLITRPELNPDGGGDKCGKGGCVPNMRGASPVGRGGGGRS